jgi:glycosyltransferase involved in cell wall biosynthesis
MKLLICTQAVDRNDTILGFFHRWIEEFAKHSEQITVICLRAGEYDLPSNVRVFPLRNIKYPDSAKATAGRQKSNIKNRAATAMRFWRYIFRLRREYDAVFVHMNQEYVLLGGLFWRLSRKRIFMWRNHYAGSWSTDIAASLCTKVFCTSRHSYTAKYQKTILMPVGIDTDVFKPVDVARQPRSILFLGRIAPSKHPDLLLRALKQLADEHVSFVASMYGSSLPNDAVYAEGLKTFVIENGLSEKVVFHGGIPNRETPRVYSAHQIFVNLSSSGMLDKTIFEAMACGCVPLVSNKDIAADLGRKQVFTQDDVHDLARKLRELLDSSGAPYRPRLIEKNSLHMLGASLMGEMGDARLRKQ